MHKQPLKETHTNGDDKNKQNLRELMALGRLKREAELARVSRLRHGRQSRPSSLPGPAAEVSGVIDLESEEVASTTAPPARLPPADGEWIEHADGHASIMCKHCHKLRGEADHVSHLAECP